MARSSGKKSQERAKRKRGRKGIKKSSSQFRTAVPAELVARLLKTFVQTVRTGLDLVLTQPSKRACDVLKRHPLWVLSPELNLVTLTWTAWMAWERPWDEFCRIVLADPEWQELLSASDQATLEERRAHFDAVIPQVIALAVHDALKAGDKQDNRPEADKRPVQSEFARSIGVAQVLKLLKKRIRPILERLDQADRQRQAHRPRDYLSRSFLLADLMRWLLHLPSTDELIRHLREWAHLAGAVNFTPGRIPDKATFSRRRMLLPIEELLAILHALVKVLVKLGVIDGRAWVIDLTRIPTYSSVKKEYPQHPNNKSDPEAEFCGYRDNDDALQLGYSLVFLIDFRSELPFACLFANGSAHDAPLARPALQQACAAHPDLADRCIYALADGNYDTIDFFTFILHRLQAIPVVTRNTRNAADPDADLTTDTLALLRRPGPLHQALFNCRSAVERTHSRAKLTFNLKYHKHRGWEAVQRCCLLSTIAMLAAALAAVETGHPDKVRKAWTWVRVC